MPRLPLAHIRTSCKRWKRATATGAAYDCGRRLFGLQRQTSTPSRCSRPRSALARRDDSRLTAMPAARSGMWRVAQS